MDPFHYPVYINKKPATIPRDFVKPHLIEVELPVVFWLLSWTSFLSQAKEKIDPSASGRTTACHWLPKLHSN